MLKRLAQILVVIILNEQSLGCLKILGRQFRRTSILFTLLFENFDVMSKSLLTMASLVFFSEKKHLGTSKDLWIVSMFGEEGTSEVLLLYFENQVNLVDESNDMYI